MGEQTADVATFMTDLAMGESARWHGGRFWCSDGRSEWNGFENIGKSATSGERPDQPTRTP